MNWNNIKKAFGLSADPEADDYIQEDDPMVELPEMPHITSNHDPRLTQQDLAVEPEMMTRIFDRVVEVINESLPQFLSASVDPEKQRQYLFDSLDASVRDYIRSLESTAQARCQAMWQTERDNLSKEMDALRKKTAELEEKRADLKEKQLSADRQKRALSDRVHDLESQVLRLEAEKEQYELENKGLLNKAKVVSVYESEVEELRKQLADLHEAHAAAQTSRLQAPSTSGDLDSETERRKLLAIIDELKNCIQDRENALSKAEASLSNLQERLSEAEAHLKDTEEKLAEAERRLSESASPEEIEEIKKQIELFESVKEKMDSRITRLRESLQAARDENESLRETIKNNLLQHAEQEKSLRQQLDTLKLQAQSQAPAAEEQRRKRRRPRPADSDDTTDVEDVLGDTDWLVSVPPEGSSMRSTEVNDPDFGYQPQKRPRPIPDNDAQMSLFDL